MADPFIGEIRMFAGNFAPRQWAMCNGQVIAISQNDALFSLIGTFYGGDGRSTFAIPDMRGRIPMQWGNGPGLTPRPIGQKTGEETVTLLPTQIPSHTHAFQASLDSVSSVDPTNTVLGTFAASDQMYTETFEQADKGTMNSSSVMNAGGSQAHTNSMPFQCLTYIICLLGVYPSRN
ncbi:phage tail protein [Pseudoalteromonas sp. T1lg24]|uniref:phage tail protein n=1 Tax=Pseudoalteromonas sp. T1lg24 TaxID=2077099 RepID=UPI000CF6F34B|nr:tail fiber protein [Pseudoalteromonas sp. T1lg24]